MIRLKVEDYCHDCPNFNPVVKNRQDFFNLGEQIVPTDQDVVCENWNVCRRVAKYLKRKKLEPMESDI